MPAPFPVAEKAAQLGVTVSRAKHEDEDFYSFDYHGEHIIKHDLSGLLITLDDLIAEQEEAYEMADAMHAEALAEMAAYYG